MSDVALPGSSISVVVLTYNSEKSIRRTLVSAREVSNDIHIVDSYSADATLSICHEFECKIVQRPFKNYADQRNWAIDNLPLASGWQLHLDADEELTAELISAIKDLNLKNATVNGWIIGRKIVFLGCLLRYGSVTQTWHYRLFRSGFGRCEDRLYDQHFVSRGAVGRINAFMLDHQETTISGWTVAHNRWSDLEALEVVNASAGAVEISPSILGNPIQRKRFAKLKYYQAPIFLRAVLYFFYRYVVCLGFLDGIPGLIFHVLQGFWFRFLVDAKIYELRLERKSPKVVS